MKRGTSGNILIRKTLHGGHFMGNLLTLFTNSYLFCACFGGVLFILMFIMSIVGIGHDAECDCEVHDGGIGEVSIISIKGIIAFITFYGLSGICFKVPGWGGWIISVISGVVMMFVTAAVIALIVKLQHSGNVAPESLVGCAGKVYLSIPGEGKSGGQVSVTLPGSTRVVAAVADEALETGAAVVVEQYLGEDLYKVVRKK